MWIWGAPSLPWNHLGGSQRLGALQAAPMSTGPPGIPNPRRSTSAHTAARRGGGSAARTAWPSGIAPSVAKPTTGPTTGCTAANVHAGGSHTRDAPPPNDGRAPGSTPLSLRALRLHGPDNERLHLLWQRRRMSARRPAPDATGCPGCLPRARRPAPDASHPGARACAPLAMGARRRTPPGRGRLTRWGTSGRASLDPSLTSPTPCHGRPQPTSGSGRPRSRGARRGRRKPIG